MRHRTDRDVRYEEHADRHADRALLVELLSMCGCMCCTGRQFHSDGDGVSNRKKRNGREEEGRKHCAEEDT